MVTIPRFDRHKYYLGKMCHNGHDFHELGKSLRYKTNRVCTKCGTKRRAIDKKKLIKQGRCLDCYGPVENGGRTCSACALVNSLRQYNLTPDCYYEMLDNQNGLCAICGTKPDKKRLEVDHCHKTGLVRGLLCHICNTGLGYFHDSTDKLEVAIKYLETTERRVEALGLLW
jgi:uncharacterized CHY-type Zn-finger protein